MAAKISLQNAAFSYGERDIFRDLNLEVLKGDLLCVLGSNGCGKTTLLSCLNGALKVKTGQVCLDGRPISSMSSIEIARKIGVVFQEHNAPFPYSVLEVVRMGRAPHLGLFSAPSRKDTEIAERVLEIVGITHLKDKRYTQISGGERQLALIARTLAQEPEIILLDEPTSHLDFKNQTLMLRTISKLAGQGLSIVMSSHLPNHALLHSSRVALMNNGQFLAVGNPDEVMTEENLRTIYGIEVRILSAKDPSNGSQIRFCIPASETANVIISGLSGIENVFEGVSQLQNGIATIDIGSGINIEAVTRQQGQVKVYVPSEAIILSMQPSTSSGRNVFKGQITGIFHQDATTKIEVDIGQKIAVLITRKSFEEMGIRMGDKVLLTFKATSVRVF